MSKTNKSIIKEEHISIENASFALEHTKGHAFADLTSHRTSSHDVRKKMRFYPKHIDDLIEVLEELKKELG